MTDQLHPYDETGTELDASFRVEQSDGGGAVFFASRGGKKGTRAARNIQYHIGLTIVLTRLKELRATLADILLDSTKTRMLPPPQRRLHFPPNIHLPIFLPEIQDIAAFRLIVSEAQRNVLTAPGRSSKHGNRVRSIKILFTLPSEHEPLVPERVAQFLRGDQPMLPTPDLDELNSRTKRLKSRGRISRPTGNRTPPVMETSSTKRYLRLPSVVAYVLQRAEGKCELCKWTPFINDEGEPYLEVHHVIQLANGGPDTPENAVALCPNCHRELHYGAQRGPRVASLYAKIPELAAS